MIWKDIAAGDRVLVATKNAIELRWSGYAAAHPAESYFRKHFAAVPATVVGVGKRKGHLGKETLITVKLDGSDAISAFPAYAVRMLRRADVQ